MSCLHAQLAVRCGGGGESTELHAYGSERPRAAAPPLLAGVVVVAFEPQSWQWLACEVCSNASTPPAFQQPVVKNAH